jgi:N-acetyl-gamma-glutamyl-phosphate reductase
MTQQLRIAILGASGYTGGELLRLLMPRADVKIIALTAERNAGQKLDAIWPQYSQADLPTLIPLKDLDPKGLDLVFCALPHGTTQAVITALPRDLKIVDLSADFRLSDPELYRQWYGQAHSAPDLQCEAVYGLSEIHRHAISTARLVANPGCYPTAAQLPLIPLLRHGLIATDDIIINAKSGVSGAGRTAQTNILFAEVAEGMQAYGVGQHRHTPEIEAGLSLAAAQPVMVSFTPHLVPINRGMLCTINVRLNAGVKAADIHALWTQSYASEPFVQILPQGSTPSTRHVRGTNLCQMAVFQDRLPQRVILLAVIDNLVKGAAGQALQNMNLMLGCKETAGLELSPLIP